jgi:lipopolysaccharide/colanic/teichoic acid biosynthesis glycosyltransferase
MLTSELRAPARPPGVGAVHRTAYPKLVEPSAVDVGPAPDARSREALSPAAQPSIGLSGARSYYVGAKVAGEWLLSVLLLAATSPLIALLAALVKLTSAGPAFYLQTRLGRNRVAFRICKLRTMVHNCEAATGAVWASKEDPRATPIGRLLRMTHLDELPQLWNVVRGEMSLIGPRPERPEIAGRIERVLPNYGERLLVRPGVTGLAQMRVPADTGLDSVRQKLAHDLYYIQNVGLLLDLRIAVCTAFHFAQLACEAVCEAVVGSHGRAVEMRIEEASAQGVTVTDA